MNPTIILAGIGNPEIWLIALVLIVVLFGGKKIPELMRGVGRGMGELQKGISEGKQHLESAMTEEPKPAATTTPAEDSQPRQATAEKLD